MARTLRQIVIELKNAFGTRDFPAKQYKMIAHQVTERDLSDLYWAIAQDYPDDDTTGSSRATLLGKLWNHPRAKTVQILKKLYPELPKTDEIQEFSLATFSVINTPTAIQTLRDLLLKHKPALMSVDSNVFDRIAMRPKHAGILFPKITVMMQRREYRHGIYAVAAAALTAKTIRPSALKCLRPRLIRDFREAMSDFAKSTPFKEARLLSVRYASAVVTVMGAFPEDRAVKKIAEECTEHADPQVAFVAYRVCRLCGWTPRPGATRRLAANPATRLDLFELLRKLRCEDEFPAEYKTQAAFAEGDMVRCLIRECGNPPRTIKLFQKRIHKYRGHEGRYYVYRFVDPSISRERLIGISGPQPLDLHEMSTAGSCTFTALNPTSIESVNLHFERVNEDLRILRRASAKPRKAGRKKAGVERARVRS